MAGPDYKKLYLEERVKVFKLQSEILQLRYDQVQKALADTERDLKNYTAELVMKKAFEEKEAQKIVKTTKKTSKRSKKDEKD